MSSVRSLKQPPSEILIDTEFSLKIEHAINSINWAIESFENGLVLTTSFGIQSVVLLHLAITIKKDIPIIWIDTGYLPIETYLYANQLKELFEINLKTYQSDLTPAHMEAIHGKLWESSNPDDHRLYGIIRKVLPMKRALHELNVKCLLIGLRRSQTDHRSNLKQFEFSESDNCFKFYPLLNWTDEDIQNYFQKFNLPYHPLFYKGYTTVGDIHSSRPKLNSDLTDRMTRFRGTGQQECGLHTEVGSYESYSNIVNQRQRREQYLSISPNTITDDLSLTNNIFVEGFYTIYTRSSCKYCRATKNLFKEKGLNYREIEVITSQTLPQPPSTITSTITTSTTTSTTTTVTLDDKVTILIDELILKVQKARNDSTFTISTVPQIFFQNHHVGGYTDLCKFLSISDDDQERYLNMSI